MRTLYFECNSGISGDMTLGALIDAGVPSEYLRAELDKLGVDGYQLNITRVKKCGIEACAIDVVLEHEHHEHEYHGHDQHKYGHHEHKHRGLYDIVRIIKRSKITDGAKSRAIEIFTMLAEAEAAVHGLDIEHVHFHEVGAIDSIVDVVGAAICLDYLNADRIICSELSEGSGSVKCQHGLMPVPVPATAKLIMKRGAPLRITSTRGEMITPTGAAIICSMCDEFVTQMPAYKLEAVGCGAGKKDFEHANILRVFIMEQSEYGSGMDGEILEITANVDDMTGESLGYFMSLALSEGAKDVYIAPVHMKKNRPGHEITLLCSTRDRERFVRLMFSNTTTIGLRERIVRRAVMTRELEIIATPYGEARVKVCSWDDIKKCYVEYEDAAAIAMRHGMTIDEAYRAVLAVQSGSK